MCPLSPCECHVPCVLFPLSIITCHMFFFLVFYVSCVISHLPFAMCNVSFVICKLPCVICLVLCTKCHMAYLLCHVTCVMCHGSCTMCHVPRILCHMSCAFVLYHVSCALHPLSFVCPISRVPFEEARDTPGQEMVESITIPGICSLMLGPVSVFVFDDQLLQKSWSPLFFSL